ncbi:sugar phosphate isomerase/epimerase family protein [Alicyclobacillus mengziensis]|uniref:Sugar phosphate isomerase/epimerase n=1 Tax=Alicyclobacillus mengziensis TaxID=2931921 RepID=A0A9X7W321_9BACL|nr:sugar phosphate isomerase/epimerase [Alicyclobacillus mengziensis]QSO49272.1 sugar phosphate isomerase/epimerase [Alicyclobacillus mengziensis]
MKFAFSRPTRNVVEQDELFERFWSAGFDGLQLKPNQYRAYLEDPQAFLERWGRVAGVSSALISAGTLDDEGLSFLQSVLRFAGVVGSERVVFCHTVPRDDVSSNDIRNFARILSELGEEAKELGTKLSLHHHYNQPVMYQMDMEIFFNEVTEGSVGLTIDTAHLVKSGISDVAGTIRSFAQYIDNFHLKDFADGDWRVLGEGAIDFTGIIQAMKDIQYDGWVSADEESGTDILRGMQKCRAFLLQLN